MNQPPFHKNQVIQSFDAGWLNTLREMASWFRSQRSTLLGGGDRNPRPLRIHNTSGAAVSRFGVLGLDGSEFDPEDQVYQSGMLLKGVSPVLADHAGRFVVCLDPIANGKIGRCVVSGLVQCRVDIQDADDQWCDVAAGDLAKLKSYGAGSAEILHAEAGTGPQWCLVQLGKSFGPATRYRGLVNKSGGFTDSDTTIPVDELRALNGVPVHTSLAAVVNVDGWSGGDNDIIWIYWNAQDEQWEIDNIGCSTGA